MPTRRAAPLDDATFEDYAAFVADYTLDKAHEMSGVPKNRLEEIAELYADPDTKVMSLWTMGVNQHTRGVWVNNLIYNLHLLTGKDLRARQQPVLADRPAIGLRHRARGRHLQPSPAGRHGRGQPRAPGDCGGEDLEAPGRHDPGEARLSRGLQNRMLKDGKLNAYWVQVNNNMQAAPNMMQEGLPGYRNPENFIVVSDAYPTVTAEAADLILPTAMWVEKEGAYGNAERRTQFWHQLIDAPGESRSDLWQVMEFSKRFTTEEVWPAELLDAAIPTTRARRCSMCSSPTARWTSLPAQRTSKKGTPITKSEDFGFYARKVCSRNTRFFGRGKKPTIWRPSTPTTKGAACAGRWSTARRRVWRFPRGLTTLMSHPARASSFYGKPDGRANIIFALPYEPPAESTRRGLSVLAVDRAGAGALAFGLDDPKRVPELYKAFPGRRLLHASRRCRGDGA